MVLAWLTSSSRTPTAANMDDARINRSSGRRPTRPQNFTRSNCLKTSPSPLSIPSLKRSARKGSRARRCVSCTSRRDVKEGASSYVETVELAQAATMSRRMKWRYASIP
ncbi:hypothetical protein FRC03_012721 [Tulasnella sp. 419]|nr:hypothetical protein FRC03_012721 [Tulasnella sp. 419]